MVNRALIDFLIRNGRGKEAEDVLDKILEKQAKGKPGPSDEVNWARRTRALLLAHSGDYQQTRRALTLVEPIAKALDAQGKPGDASVSADDIRTLAEVYDAENQ